MIGLTQYINTRENGTADSPRNHLAERIHMTTSQTQSFLTEILDGNPIPLNKLEYFRARLRSRLHQLVLGEFLRQEDKGLHQAELARRINRKPEVINRLLGAPGNWTLNTISDLLLGMGAEPEFRLDHFKDSTVSPDEAANLLAKVSTGQPRPRRDDGSARLF
jgi:hypothetical protein